MKQLRETSTVPVRFARDQTFRLIATRTLAPLTGARPCKDMRLINSLIVLIFVFHQFFPQDPARSFYLLHLSTRSMTGSDLHVSLQITPITVFKT
ncbi:MAG: hypothetical protein ACRD3W_26665, partial [Terriglobales bacterium]